MPNAACRFREPPAAMPEPLGAHAIAPLHLGNHVVSAYTLERLAGEKLRAFLSTLPTHRKKLGGGDRAVRAKDLYDLAGILAEHPISNDAFWQVVFDEFRMACAARYVDCAGAESFFQDIDVTRATYRSDRTIPPNIGVVQAEHVVGVITGRLEAAGFAHFTHRLLHAPSATGQRNGPVAGPARPRRIATARIASCAAAHVSTLTAHGRHRTRRGASEPAGRRLDGRR